MLKIERISEVLGKHVYTVDGDYFGQVEGVSLVDNRVEGWKIRVGTAYRNAYGGARGVIIPHQFVKSIGDVFVISRVSSFKEEPQSMPGEGIDIDESI